MKRKSKNNKAYRFDINYIYNNVTKYQAKHFHPKIACETKELAYKKLDQVFEKYKKNVEKRVICKYGNINDFTFNMFQENEYRFIINCIDKDDFINEELNINITPIDFISNNMNHEVYTLRIVDELSIFPFGKSIDKTWCFYDYNRAKRIYDRLLKYISRKIEYLPRDIGHTIYTYNIDENDKSLIIQRSNSHLDKAYPITDNNPEEHYREIKYNGVHRIFDINKTESLFLINIDKMEVR